MKQLSLSLICAMILLSNCAEKKVEHLTTSLRAPAYPLITIDPYTSLWSMSDNLYDTPTKHWTGKNQSMIGAVRVDGQVYRFMGKEEVPLESVIPMAGEENWTGQYTFSEPKKGWEQADFDTKGWSEGQGAFGYDHMKSVKTIWEDNEIWVRREFDFPETNTPLYLIFSHDDDFELYINGTQVVNTGNAARFDVVQKIDASLINQGGKNVIAAHCLDRQGWAYVDFGIYTESDLKEVFTQTAKQTGVSLSATQTIYSFNAGPVNLDVSFTSPLLMDDLNLLSRPVNYIDYSVASNDGKEHEVQVFFEMSPQFAVNDESQEVSVESGSAGEVSFLRTGTTSQNILGKKGDNVRIDWGYAYLAGAPKTNGQLAISKYFDGKSQFARSGGVGNGLSTQKSKITANTPVMTYADDLGSVDQGSGFLMLGYDDLYAIQYFDNNLKAWWAQDGSTFSEELADAGKSHDLVISKCVNFDNEMWNEAVTSGGKAYADLCVLAYRQSIAAHKLTKDNEGNILFLSKENFSNGSIGTVDVTYPSAPLFLKYNPDLLKGMLNPIFYYSESGKWTKPFAAHDVGTYPLANGQTYGGDMPVEESGNMIILTAAIAEMEGNANYAKDHWEVLTVWANYLLENGLDPENQLCTDDFAGHFAHNANLSIKAIMGIASYGRLAEMLGKPEISEKYTAEARKMASEWEKMAADGDHYKLTFDKEGTWSQKYNLVWDKLLGYEIFPEEIVKKEIPYYLTVQNDYGLPLDNRRTYTKSDWIVWTATLADNKETFQKFINPVHDYVTSTPDRVPMSDWYETPDAEQVGFQARSVVGGYFIKMLEK